MQGNVKCLPMSREENLVRKHSVKIINVITALKMRQSSNIWEQSLKIKIAFMKKLTL
jgi:hypothetical protein